MTRALIGIDVGWSEKRRSCSVAIRAAGLPLPLARTYGTRTRVSRYTLQELLTLIRTWRSVHSATLANAIIVIDGPCGPGGRPTCDRYVDAACASDTFHQRCQPVRISHPGSRAYIEATHRILEALGMEDSVWMGGEVPQQRAVVAETHPTVALALLVEPQPINTLPSRKRAREVDGRLVRAKSDWYWACGADKAVERILRLQGLVEEHDHERIAALLCLAVAVELEAHSAIALGAADGIYAVPHLLASGWMRDVERIGVRGAVKFLSVPSRAGMESCPTVNVDLLHFPAALSEEGEDHAPAKGDVLELILADSGGVNENQNEWTEGMPQLVRLRTLTPEAISVTLRHGKGRKSNKTQWVVDPTTSQIRERLARYFPEHDLRRALSKTNVLAVPVEVL